MDLNQNFNFYLQYQNNKIQADYDQSIIVVQFLLVCIQRNHIGETIVTSIHNVCKDMKIVSMYTIPVVDMLLNDWYQYSLYKVRKTNQIACDIDSLYWAQVHLGKLLSLSILIWTVSTRQFMEFLVTTSQDVENKSNLHRFQRGSIFQACGKVGSSTIFTILHQIW